MNNNTSRKCSEILARFDQLEIPAARASALRAAIQMGVDQRVGEPRWEFVITGLRVGNDQANQFAVELATLTSTEIQSVDADEAPATVNPAKIENNPVLAAVDFKAKVVTDVASSLADVGRRASDSTSPRKTKTKHNGKASTPDVNQSGSNGVRSPVPLKSIATSRWNRSYGVPMADQHVTVLVGRIQRDGLLHAITLVPNPDGPEPYTVVAGANRLAALIKLRGLDGVLEPHEYTLRADVDERDRKCLDISVSENHDRKASSPHELGVYAARLVNEQGILMEDIAGLLHIPRETVSRLISLSKHYADLPASWQQDLRVVPGCDSNHTPPISTSHWAVVAGMVADPNTAPDVRSLMDRAHSEQWSVARLREEIQTTKPAAANKPVDTAAQAAGDKLNIADPESDISNTRPRNSTTSDAKQVRAGINYLLQAEECFSRFDDSLAQYVRDAISRAEQALSCMNPKAESRKAA